MADDTPDTPAPETPAPRRRAAPRKPGTKAATPRKAVAKATGAAGAAVAAVKPRSTSRGPARPAAKRATKAAADTATPRAAKKPAAKRGTTARTGTSRTSGKANRSTLDRATDAVGGRLAAAAIGVAAAGATVAAVLTLRGSSAKNLGTKKKPIDITGSGDKGKGHPVDVHGTGGAHQPDGTDSSASFAAGIADENTVPGRK